MRVAATETPEKEVFTLDPKKSLKKSFLWLFGQLVFLLLAAWGVFSHSTPGMILAVLSVILMLLRIRYGLYDFFEKELQNRHC